MTEETLFERAVQLPTGERAAFLDRECAGQPELRARVEALLAADAVSHSPLDRPVAVPERTGEYTPSPEEARPASRERLEPHPDSQASTVIAGKYTLVEVIGEGGMGSVWRAKQTEPVKRFVAVKLIKVGMDSKQVLARFDAERQALALMDHPNIAKVLDAGVVEAHGQPSVGVGRPFFVMELVKGVPITDYCDANKQTPPQRLELFVQACQAIQHAHQKGIIHRDIKPSNVLVALYDDKPVVKVIDFGVAKATGGTLTEATIDTGIGGVVGTPQYMSPEQATFNNLDIDTRSDVYALGVLLYELLAGSPPFSSDELKKKGFLEILRVVREEEPPRPSTKLSTADALPSLSANRGTEPKKLTGLLRNELDWIVMKALEKDRTRRYETANGFAADVQRYLAGEAVQAHPPSMGYRLKKFVRRNKGQVIAASLVLFALLAGVAAAVAIQVHANRVLADKNDELIAEQAKVEARNQELAAEQEKVQARFALAQKAIKTFHTGVSEDVLLKSDQHRDLRTRLLREAADFYAQMEKLLEGQTDRRSRTELGHGYFELAVLTRKIGTAAEAMAVLRKALSVRHELAAAGDPESGLYLAQSLQEIAYLLMATGDSAGAWKHLEEQSELLNRLDVAHPKQGTVKAALAAAHHTVGNFFLQSGKPKEALESFRKAAQIHSILVENNPKSVFYQYELAGNHNNIGSCLFEMGKPNEALDSLQHARRILATLAKVDPAYRSHWANSLSNISTLHGKMGHLAEAMKFLQEARDIGRQLVRDNPTVTEYQNELAIYHSNFAILQVQSRRYNDALASYQEALSVREKLADAHPSVTEYQHQLAKYHYSLGQLHQAIGQPGEALAAFEKASTIARKLVNAHPKVAAYQSSLAKCLHGVGAIHAYTGNAKSAIDSLRHARDIQHGLVAPHLVNNEHLYDLTVTCSELGLLLRGAGQLQDAAESFRQCVAISQRLAENNRTIIPYQSAHANHYNSVGLIESDLGNFKESLTAYQQSRSIHQRLLKADPTNPEFLGGLARNFNNIGRLHAKLGQFDEAFAALDQGLAIRQKLADADSKTAGLAVSLGFSHAYRGWAGVRAGRTAEAAKDLRRTLELWRKAPLLTVEHRFEIFRALALLAGLGAHAKPGVTAAEAKTYADQAVAAFGDAIKAGWAKPDELKEPDFDAVRGRDDFRKLLADLEAKFPPKQEVPPAQEPRK